MFYKITTLMCLAGIAGYVLYPAIQERISPKMSEIQASCQSLSEVDKDPLVMMLQKEPATAPSYCREYSFYWN